MMESTVFQVVGNLGLGTDLEVHTKSGVNLEECIAPTYCKEDNKP